MAFHQLRSRCTSSPQYIDCVCPGSGLPLCPHLPFSFLPSLPTRPTTLHTLPGHPEHAVVLGTCMCRSLYTEHTSLMGSWLHPLHPCLCSGHLPREPSCPPLHHRSRPLAVLHVPAQCLAVPHSMFHVHSFPLYLWSHPQKCELSKSRDLGFYVPGAWCWAGAPSIFVNDPACAPYFITSPSLTRDRHYNPHFSDEETKVKSLYSQQLGRPRD